MEISSSSLCWSLVALAIFAVLHRMLTTYHHNGLNRYPGPLLASVTRFWYRLSVQSNKHQQTLIKLHRKYGDVVRIGLNLLSLANAEYVPRLYGFSPGYLKSEMYDVFAQRVDGKRVDSSLSVRDPKAHSALHKPVAKTYSMTAVTEYEPLVDEMIVKLLHRMREENAREDTICDLGLWIRCYAFDVIQQVTLSDTMGFIDAGGDIYGFFRNLDAVLDRSGLLVTMPWTARLVKHNPIVALFSTDGSMFPRWSAVRLQRRLKQRSEASQNGVKYSPRDFLDRFIDAAHRQDPPGFDFPLAINWTMANIMAGGDTTTIALRAVMYYLIRNPSKKAKLVEELQAANLSIPVSWAQSQKLPYLDAVIKEALRMHPSIGLSLERMAGGFEMADGYVLPPGTNVGMNAWVVNRQPVFGDNVDEFVPERWLRKSGETEEEHTQRLNHMRRVDLVFGSGPRSCTGKNVSFLEMYKVVPALLLTFSMEMVNGKDEWMTINRWTVRQDNISCILRERGK